MLRKDLDGSVEAAELSELPPADAGELLSLEADLAMLLAEEDVEAIGGALEPEAARSGACVRESPGRARSHPSVRRSGGQLVANGRIPTQALLAASRSRRANRRWKGSEMPLARARVGRPGVWCAGQGGATAVVGTAAVVSHRHNRREDRRDDRGDRRDDRGVLR